VVVTLTIFGQKDIEEKYLNSINDLEECNISGTYDSYTLTLSWLAGFCEHSIYSNKAPECDALNSTEISVTNITIHGLWPNKKKCGRNYNYCTNNSLNLKETTINEISPWMPSFYYSTNFGDHEWKKHGTCQELSDDEYFLLTKRLVKKIDSSSLGKYVRKNMGKYVRVSKIKNHLELTMNENFIKKIELYCSGDKKRYLSGFKINLPKKINDRGTISELILGAEDRINFSGNCTEKIYIEAPGI
jgi:ribonuclease T2